MLRWTFACALAMAASLLPAAAAAQQPSAQPEEVYLFKNPQPAPSLEVTTLNGQRISLAALRGKVVLLNFWATWCGPCRQEIPEFEQLQRIYAGKLQVVGMSVDELPPAAVQKTATAMGINYPVAMATEALQKRFGGMPSIPVTWVIDRNGQVEQKNHGANPYEVFDTEVRTLLGLPTKFKVARIDQLSPNGKVGTIDIPGIAADLRALSPAQRQEALAKLNEQACTCGCEWSLATCRVQDPSCGFSLPQARQLIAAIKNGAATKNGAGNKN
ncbi:MAG TPA: TlpA disulfide reductase family protein [Terriglobales bacterium]|nr:TlpA disulfide reductase family protein [Terriglobales bacterium]